MASCSLIVMCGHRVYTLTVYPQTCWNEIIENIASHFNLTGYSFNLEIYDEQIRMFVDFDEQYDKELRQRLPKTHQQTLQLRVSFSETSDSEEHSDQENDISSSLNELETSLVGSSPMNDQIISPADIDMDCCLLDDSSKLSDGISLNLQDGCSHITFVRDVIPYEKNYYSTGMIDDEGKKKFTKGNYVRRVQGIKNNWDERYTSVLPEIKIPLYFLHQDRFQLLIAVVLEELNDKQITWHLHKLKGFLRDNSKTNVTPLNPLYLDIERSMLTKDGIFKLPLRMCDILLSRFVKKDDAIFHSLPAAAIPDLHPAVHTSDTPRLACVIADRSGAVCWDTFGLSDFIHPMISLDPRTHMDISSTNEPASDLPIAQPECEGKRQHIIQNFLLVWLDCTIDESSNDFLNSFVRLQCFVNVLNTFTDIDECIDFVSDITNEKVFLITSGSLGRRVLPLVHNIPQLDSIYIFCENKSIHERWAKDWPKINGVFNDITQICESLDQAVRRCDQQSISFSFASTDETPNRNLDELDQSFMYTQILKEILLTIDFDQTHIHEFLTYCRQQYANNHSMLKNIGKFEREYHSHSPIWWYTSSCFLYSMLNRALRTLEIGTVIKMGFFIRDLHEQINNIYMQQVTDICAQSFTVYRGQGLSKEEFEKLRQNRGGLMSFNSFLSTSRDQNVSLHFLDNIQTDLNSVKVLFQITIVSSLISTPFASLDNSISCYSSEREVLFSMNTVFRIGNIEQITNTHRLWAVELTLTSDNDPSLHALTGQMREDTSLGLKGWYRLGILLHKLGEFDKAEQLYLLLLGQTANDLENIHTYCELGVIKNAQGDYSQAICFYKKALEMTERTLPVTDPWFTNLYSNIAQVYQKMGQYSNALDFYQKILLIHQRLLLSNDPALAKSHNNIGELHYQIGEHSQALLHYEKCLEIQHGTLPANHPALAITYNNIGSVYANMGEYSKAFSSHEKALQIRQKTLPANHPNIAQSYNNLGLLYNSMGDYPKAISFLEKALQIQQQSLPSNHPNLASLYNNIGMLFYNMGEYSKALSYYEKTFTIQQHSLADNHPDLASSYSNISSVYYAIGQYNEALINHKRALEIRQKTLPENHPDLATSYTSIGLAYSKMNEYSQALAYYYKALQIRQKTCPANHPHLATIYDNIGLLYANMHQHSKALSYFQKGLLIWQESLPPNHPTLATSYNNIAEMCENVGAYSNALLFLELALKISRCSLSVDHPNIKLFEKNIENLKKKL
ncbi:unnamed protein product [Adineta ricciae]|uniref:ADP ribosyltransferase domain-containing protein n=1 Tax=Adineta ricciae TaxID=249248 RepID=A0A814U9G1_ADIRI|nr:unnamed protein product [Adineta ricciae]